MMRRMQERVRDTSGGRGAPSQSRRRQPADSLRQHVTGLAPGALKSARRRFCHAPCRNRAIARRLLASYPCSLLATNRRADLAAC